VLKKYNKKEYTIKERHLVIHEALKICESQSNLNSSSILGIVAPAGKYIISNDGAVQILLHLENASNLQTGCLSQQVVQ